MSNNSFVTLKEPEPPTNPNRSENRQTPSFNEITLCLIASGLIQLAPQSLEAGPLTLPYPDSLQRGLNRLVLTCLQRGLPPLQSVPHLLDWCRLPLVDWPLDLAGEDFQPMPSDRLLDGQIPTSLCHEWAYSNGDVEAELRERQLLQLVFDVCRAQNAPNAYTAFRKFLTKNLVLTAFELQRTRLEPTLELVVDLILAAYAPAPPACIVRGEFHCCSHCGNLLLRTLRDELVCENERCRRLGRSAPGHRLSPGDDIHWLRPELRRFIAAPGRSELRLAKHIERLGVEVTLWPAFDAYDLRLVFPDGEAWAVDVKDWADPFRLARSVKPVPSEPPWARAYFAIPDDRCQERPDYLRAFRNHCRILNAQVDALSERELIAEVRRKLRGCANA